jgi:PhzF family phenazine biosynthesis protein
MDRQPRPVRSFNVVMPILRDRKRPGSVKEGYSVKLDVENPMKLPIYQVDAFASKLFQGNPAAVCPLDAWLPTPTMQAIALENNLSETAFYVPKAAGRYGLRWFTPAVEIELCGHATVATASVIMDVRRETEASRLLFDTLSGELAVELEGDRYVLDFPANPPQECIVPPGLIEALGAKPSAILGARDYLCVYDDADQVRRLTPDMAGLCSVDRRGIIVTAPGRDEDFVSRFFAPAKGVPEDPVTGSAHTTLIRYWSRRLGKTKLFARQISSRGGELWCQDLGDRVKIGGRAVQYLQGEITVSVTDAQVSAS